MASSVTGFPSGSFGGVVASPVASPVAPQAPACAPQISSCASGACGNIVGLTGNWSSAPPPWAAAMQTWMGQQPGYCGSSCCRQICQACCCGGMRMPSSFAQGYRGQADPSNRFLGCIALALQSPPGCNNALSTAHDWLGQHGFNPDVKADPWGNPPPRLWKDICKLANSVNADPKAFWALLQQVIQSAAARA